MQLCNDEKKQKYVTFIAESSLSWKKLMFCLPTKRPSILILIWHMAACSVRGDSTVLRVKECTFFGYIKSQLQHVAFLMEHNALVVCVNTIHTLVYWRIFELYPAADSCLFAQQHWCSPAPGIGSLQDEALLAVNDGALPFMQAQGPLPELRGRRDFNEVDQDLFEDCYLLILDAPHLCAARDTICARATSKPLSWTRCCRTLRHLHDELQEEHLGDAACTLGDLRGLLAELCQPAAWPFLRDSECADHLRPALQAWEQRAAHHVHVGRAAHRECIVPRPVSSHKILLHAFSGRRRRGDLEWFLDNLSSSHAGCIISVVSLDIVIDSTYGDVGRPETRSLWLHAICQGWVLAFLGGPPCNTWSRARNIQLKGGPRVVRAVDDPWGLASLRLRELQQILLGNLLLGFALECMTLLALRDGAGVMEHPKEPDEDHMVSIWRLPVVQLLLTIFPKMRLLTMAQGLLGAPSPKPTSLMVLGLAGLEDDLRAGRVTSENPRGLTVGKDETGQYRTAPLKEYPPAMCKALAQAFFRDLRQPGTGVADAPDDAFLLLVQRMKDHTFGKHIGHDG